MQRSNNHEKVLTLAAELQGIAQRNNMSPIVEAISSQALGKLQSHRFHVMIAGEFANGKTTLVNGLLRANCLPVSSGANSSRIVEIVHGSEPALTLVDGSGQRTSLSMEELPVFVQNRGAKDFHLELAHPCELCRDGVVIIDTPGLQDVNRRRVAITFKYLPRADMLIYVADATSGIKSTEYEFLGKTVRQFALAGVMVALNQVDKLSGDDAVAQVQRKTEEAVENIFGRTIPVFRVSSLKALKAILAGNEEDLRESGLPAIEDYLRNFLENERFDAVVKAAAAHLRMQCVALENGIAAFLQSLAWDPAEHETRTNKIMENIREADQRLDRIKAEFQRNLAQARLTFIGDFKGWLLNTFRREFMAKLNRANLNDLTAENVKDAVTHLAGEEIKKRWQAFALEVEKLIKELGSQCEISFRLAGAAMETALTGTELKSSPLASISPNTIAVALAVGSYLFMGLFSWIAVLFVGNMIGALDWIKQWQKEQVLKSIDDSLRQALPAAAEQVESEIARACGQVENGVMTNLAEARKATLGSLTDALEQARAERLKGQDSIAARKRELSAETEKVRDLDKKLQDLA